jgi:F-type H+-transporting ATPase subunit a
MTTGSETETVHEAATHAQEAAAHAEEGFDVGGMIMHHILDSPYVEIPFTHAKIHLPDLHLFGLDLAITKNVVMMWISCFILLVLVGLAVRRSKEAVPRGTRNLLEVLILFIRDDVARRSIGPNADRYLGYLLTTFFFILICNLLGLIPGMATATGNISVTAGLALMAFAMIQFGGIREFGVVGHFKNLVPGGVPLWLVPIMLAVEILSMFIKPFALCIRLFANMMAGHVVILALISLIFILKAFWYVAAPFAVGFALFIYLLEILVAFIQAYIFTVLTAQFIGMSVHPAH